MMKTFQKILVSETAAALLLAGGPQACGQGAEADVSGQIPKSVTRRALQVSGQAQERTKMEKILQANRRPAGMIYPTRGLREKDHFQVNVHSMAALGHLWGAPQDRPPGVAPRPSTASFRSRVGSAELYSRPYYTPTPARVPVGITSGGASFFKKFAAGLAALLGVGGAASRSRKGR